MSNGTIAPFPKHQLFTNAGLIASGYQLFTYAAGTTTKLSTYNDADLAVGHANANPIVLDSAGRATIFLTAASYKFVLASPTDSDPPASPIWTVDNVTPTQVGATFSVSGVAGEDLTINEVVRLSQGSGGETVGRWYKLDNSNSLFEVVVGIAATNIATGATGDIILYGRITGLTGLTAGVNYYASSTPGAISLGNPEDKLIGRSESTTVLILNPNSSVPAGSSAAGIVTIAAQTIKGKKTFQYAATDTGAPARYEVAVAAGSYGEAVGMSFTDYAATENSGANETTLTSHQLPANTFNANGRTVVIESAILAANTAAAKALRFFVGSEQVGADHAMNANLADVTELKATIMRNDATHVKVSLKCVNGGHLDEGDLTIQTETVVVDPTAAITWYIKGQATNNADITHYLTREYLA